MSAPQRPGAPRSSARSSVRSNARPQRPSATRSGPPSRPGPGAHSGATPRVKPRIEAAPARGSFAAVLSWRVFVLAGVLALAFALVWPSLRVFGEQQAEYEALQAERAEAQAEVDALEAELARWDDPNYVQAQARERLAYVFPGESPFRVLDPELARPAAEGSVDALAEGEDPTSEGPWYERLWSTMERDGALPAPPMTPAATPGASEPATTMQTIPGGDTPATPAPGANIDLGG